MNTKRLRLVFYDFEVFYDDWCCTFIDYPSMKRKIIINNRDEIVDFYNKCKDRYIFCGYNNVHYDDIILKALVIGEDELGISLKELSDKLVHGESAFQISNKFYKVPLISYDCMINKAMGLKQYEAFFGSKIYESNVDFNLQRKLTKEEMEETISYNIHDVEQTIKLFELTKDDFNAHVGLITTFNLPLTSFSKTKARLSATILDGERVHGLDDEMNYDFPDTLDLGKYEYVKEHFDTKRYLTYVNEKGTTKKNQLETEVYGLKSIYGFGGFHGALEKYYTDNTDGSLIVHSDIASLYPSIMIQYGLLSRGVKDPSKYTDILNKRLELKHQGKKKEQAPYKIVLNSTYGITLDKYSSLYDPKHGRSICIYGQLLMTDLLDKLEDEFGDRCIPIQYNTDGIIMKLLDKNDFPRYMEVCEKWSKRVRLNLEHDIIEKIYQLNVNMYVAVFEGGKLERKGKYFQETSILKNDLAIMPKAIVDYIIYGKSVEDTINECDDLIMYQKVCKIGKTYKYAMYGDKPLKEKVIRVFASKKDLPGLFKVKDTINKDGEEVESIQKVADTPESCYIDNGDITNKKCDDNLDKDYYINIIKKELKRMKVME